MIKTKSQTESAILLLELPTECGLYFIIITKLIFLAIVHHVLSS